MQGSVRGKSCRCMREGGAHTQVFTHQLPQAPQLKSTVIRYMLDMLDVCVHMQTPTRRKCVSLVSVVAGIDR